MKAAMTEIYLARHPEIVFNADGSLVGGRSNHIGLTPFGEWQAHAFPEAFLAHYPRPDVLYTSSARRAVALTDSFASQLGFDTYTIDDALIEMSQGHAEGKPRDTIYTKAVVRRIQQELFDFRLAGGESLNDVTKRMTEWALRMHELHPHQRIYASSHGQAIRALARGVLGWDHFETTRDPQKIVPNVSVSKFIVDDTGITLDSYAQAVIKEPSSDQVY